MNLTKTTIASLTLPPNKSEMFVWDDGLPGFGVRLRGDSTRYVVQYRIGAQQRRESLGDIRKVDIEAARKIARTRFAQIELGADPAADKAKAREAATAAKTTLGIVSEGYLKFIASRVRPSTLRGATLHLKHHWQPLASRPIDSIKRADVASQLQEITDDHGRTAAARARSNLSALFGWAMREGLIEANPVLMTNDPAEGIPSRDRILDDAELAAVWRSCQDNDFSRIVKLLILTGCRRNEIGGLKWSEVNFDTSTMTIPGSRTKNHRTHVLTLPSAAMDILRSTPKRDGRDLMFGGRGGSFSAWSFAMTAMHLRINMAEGRPLPHWTLHDLRRTMRTGLGRLGVRPDIAERTVNHVRGGIEAIYDRHLYSNEITSALTVWADHVGTIVL